MTADNGGYLDPCLSVREPAEAGSLSDVAGYGR